MAKADQGSLYGRVIFASTAPVPVPPDATPDELPECYVEYHLKADVRERAILADDPHYGRFNEAYRQARLMAQNPPKHSWGFRKNMDLVNQYMATSAVVAVAQVISLGSYKFRSCLAVCARAPLMCAG